MQKNQSTTTYWQNIWQKFHTHRLGWVAYWIVICFIGVGIYAPFLASSQPLFVKFQGNWYFPLFRYLFYSGFFTKRLDIFYNLLIFTAPLLCICYYFLSTYRSFRFWTIFSLVIFHFSLFFYFIFYPLTDPTFSKKEDFFSNQNSFLTWNFSLQQMSPYAQLEMLLNYQQKKKQYQELKKYELAYKEKAKQRGQKNPLFPLLWTMQEEKEKEKKQAEIVTIQNLKENYNADKQTTEELENQFLSLSNFSPSLAAIISLDFKNHLSTEDQLFLSAMIYRVKKYERAQARLLYLEQQKQWLEKESNQLGYQIMPLFRSFHWEEDAGGDQLLNQLINWQNLTRINRKDMVSSLLFGIRVSLSVGILAIGMALCLGIPIGAVSGYYGGKLDLIIYRIIEIWESMPTFFMLLMMVAFLQSKSIFLVIIVIGIFGWTGFSRFIRGEFFKQKQLLYAEACRALGYSDRHIIFSHLLPNALPPVLTLIPFAVIGAITSEASLSFLGLGEEGSNSWGVLMDEGRSAFPSESYLLWPPAFLLTILLVAIALIGDALRDALDPKLQQT